MTEITINRTCAILDRCEQFTSGRVGARIKFSFSSEWAGLNRTAVFTNGDTTIDVLNVTDECVIPHEVLAISGKKLKVGVYGFTADDNGNIKIAIPTVYAELGKVVKGADPSGDETTEPSLPVWAQIQDDVSDLDDRVTELEQHGSGGGTSDHRQLTNRDAANQHPISAITGLQSALDGKQASGDYATSGELDALADIVDGKADAADVPSLAGYATEAYVQNYHDNTKQDIITDLASIRSGATLGATALQSVPNTYRTATAQDAIDNGKQDKLIAGANITIAADGKTISATGGGEEVFIINITQSGGVFSADKTNAEIYAAVQANKVVYAVVGENRMQIVSATSAKAVFADTMKTNKVRNGAITIANNAVTATETILQSESITDVGNYYATDTVEGALQEIGAELDGVETALHNVNTILGGAL